MKKIICIIMAIIFVLIPLSSCDSAGADGGSQASSDSKAENISNVTESKDVISNSMNNLDNTPAAIGKIQFGLTPEELIAALKDNNMELEDPENMSDWTTGMQVSVSNPVDDGRVYYSHDGLTFFVYETKGGDLVFEYDENGKAKASFRTWPYITESHPRTAIGYYEPGHYCLPVVDGRQDSSRGMFLEEMAGLFEQLGCKAAYNLDGGHCSFMTLQGKVANHPYSPQHKVEDGIFIMEGLQ